MDPVYTSEENEFRRSVREFLARELPPVAQRVHQ